MWSADGIPDGESSKLIDRNLILPTENNAFKYKNDTRDLRKGRTPCLDYKCARSTKKSRKAADVDPLIESRFTSMFEKYEDHIMQSKFETLAAVVQNKFS